MKTPDIRIAGLGTYVPETVDARKAVALGLYDAEDHEFYGWTGAAVADDMPAPDMAIAAAQQAMERSQTHPHDLDLHLHACGHEQGPEGWSAQHYILRHLTDRDIPSFRVWQACSGLIGSLELAACYLMAVPERTTALLTGSDNVGTPNFNRWAFGIQNGVLGDAGSAVLLSTREGFATLVAINTGSTAEVEEQYRGAEPLFPPSLTVGRSMDFRERLAAAGGLEETVAEVVRRQGELRTEIALRTLAEAGLEPADVTRVAHVFTGQESYLKVILDPMGLSPDQGLLEFGRGLGHLTVSDQVVGLDHLVAEGEVGPGDHVLIVAHGGGVSITCAVVRIDRRPPWARR
ncbi:ketoacyl-ACP synthase III family protein [Streptomyces profundus]|uniref:ketoacyl-ACP synthase III family protein n=1 Tax=Streptomyces profundus TaxID=2867410 RepID=UPI001D160D87|nr:ketoacyl-ACP synthase III family protein [Streptomyces sp. MA3_2.13]UED87558.1 ketoacyl-ACP synthase III family protein [Streptomyces sp. MA3_2.13]